MKTARDIAVLGYFHGPKLGVGVFMDRLMTMFAQNAEQSGRVVFYTNRNTLDNFTGSLEGIEVRLPLMLSLGSIPAIFWSAVVFPLICLVRRMRATLILANPIVVLPVVKTVSVICDVSEFEIVEKYGPFRTFYRKHIMLASAIRYSKRLVVISQFVREQLRRYFIVADRKQVDIVNLGVDVTTPEPMFVRQMLEKKGLRSDGYYLIVGRLDPRSKNLDSALRLYKWLEENFPGRELLLVGGINESTRREAEAFLNRIKGDPWLCSRVRYLGFVDDTELSALYSAATATIFFSRVEGFGLPLVEAFKLGCPVIYNADCEVLRDHADGAAFAVRENDIEGRLPRDLQQFLSERDRTDLKAKMAEVAARYDWRACADDYLRILDEVAQ